MRHSSRTVATAILVIVLTSLVRLSAQPPVGVVRGEVSDASGGVLPGVTISATAPDGRVLATTVSDRLGRFVLSGVPVGPVKIVFQLDGFDTGIVEVNVASAAESVIVERLTLASLTEQVVVYGKAPEEPKQEIRYVRPAPPTIVPLPTHDLESVCGPAKRSAIEESLGTIQSHAHDGRRVLYTKGDELLINGGTLDGLEIGRNLVVRRYFQTNRAEESLAVGEHTSGVIQIVSAAERSSTAVVVYACDELMKGDFVAEFRAEPVRMPDPAGTPDFDDPIRILFADIGQMLGVGRRMLVIGRGSGQSLQVGQRVTLFRRDRRNGGNPIVLGEAVVVALRTDSATVRVHQVTDAIFFDDWAAPQREGPLAMPMARSGGSQQ